MVSEKKSVLKRILIIIIVALIAFSAVSFVATKIIYDNIFTRHSHSCQIPSRLTAMTSAREKSEYYSGENKLCGYLYRSAVPNKHNSLIVIVAGFNSCSNDYLWQIKSLLDYGWSVFIFDATGSNASEGNSTVGFSQILIDLDETLKYIENNNRFGYNELALMGHSRGGYAACCALKYNYDISAVISISGINSAMEGVIGSATNYVGPLAYGNYGFLWAYQAILFGSEIVNTEASEEISKSNVPVLVIHGENDTTVPADKYSIISYKDKIKCDNAQYILCTEDGQDGHTDLLFDTNGGANGELMEQINTFLVRNLK